MRVTDSRSAMATRVIADLSINKDERAESHQRHEVWPGGFNGRQIVRRGKLLYVKSRARDHVPPVKAPAAFHRYRAITREK